MSDKVKENIHALLKKYWGFDTFRPMQEEIVTAVTEKKDVLALLPTGGGKSVCFQVPALALGGTCIVISPLIALMNDQVSNLKKKGISAVAISSAMNYKEIEIALNNAALGHVQFLYISPERLQNEDFRMKLSYLPVTLIAVDEAHCISQWGYDFRPSYLQVASLRAYFPEVSVVALTASATGPVIEDIQTRLEFKNASVFRQSFARRNLRYVVQKEENKIERLLKLITNIGGSGVVYVRNRKKTEELANVLRKNKISALAYHAGLKYEERQTIQQSWIDNKIQVITATNAFGMGIDKPDVRWVVHLDLPDTLEAYFQEAGRGGRDGKTAYAAVFYSPADQEKLLDNLKNSFPETDYIKRVYTAICNYYQVAINSGGGISFEFDIEKISSSYNLQPVLVYNSLRFLEKDSYLSLMDTGYEPSKILLRANKEDLYEFQVRHPKYEILIKTLLRSYGGLFENYVPINEKDIAYRAKINAAAVSQQLTFLDEHKVLSYIPQSSLPRVMFLQDRIDHKYLQFNKDTYFKLKENSSAKIQSVIDYTNNDKICRQVQLLMYFNEHVYSDCGYCDVCIGARPKNYSKIKQTLKTFLSEKPLSVDVLKLKMAAVNTELWISAFNELIDDGEVTEHDGVYSIRPPSRIK